MANYQKGSLEEKLTNALHWLEHSITDKDTEALCLDFEDARDLYDTLYETLDLIDDLKRTKTKSFYR